MGDPDTRLRLAAKFYMIAMFFVTFDVEALFTYAWAVALMPDPIPTRSRSMAETPRETNIC